MSESVSPAALGEAWTANDATFGARLALVRQRMGWGNVKEAAIACGIAPQSWRSWERDGVMPHGSRYFGLCAQISRATGCDYGWLVDRRPSGASEPTVAYVRANLALVRRLGASQATSAPWSPLLHLAPTSD